MPTLTTNWQTISSAGLISNVTISLEGRYTSQSATGNYTDTEFRIINYASNSTQWRTTSGTANFTGAFTDSGSAATYPNYVVNGTVLLTISKRVYHGNDGTKSFDLGAHVDAVMNGTRYNANPAQTTVTLPKINRISPIVSFSGNDVEGNFSATYTQYVSDYTMKLRISIPNVQSLQTFDNYSSGSNVTLNSSSITAIQTYMNNNNTNQVTLGAVIETWNGSTKVGESSEIKNVCYFSNASPTISNTETETDANVITYYGSTASTVVQSVSKVRCEVTATAQKGASISSVVITHNGVSYSTTLSSGKYVATIPISANSFVISVSDNRGNSATKNVTKTMINYMPVDFKDFSIKRVNSTSSNIRFDIEATYYQQTFGSTANVPTVKYKLGSGSYVTIPSNQYSISNNKLTISNFVAENLIVYTTTGQITLYIEDLLSSDTEGGTKAYVTKGVPTFDAGDTDVQINGELFIANADRSNAKEIRDLIYPVGSIYISVNSTNPSTLFGGTWEAFATGRTLVGVDTNDSNFNSSEQTGGNKTHTHGSDTSQNGTLSAVIGATSSNPLRIGYSASNKLAVSQVNATYSILGTSLEQNASFNHYTEVRGTTESGSSLQPYITVYMWKRVS